jgi:uncharacterized membrane protein
MRVLGWIFGFLVVAYPLAIYFFRDEIPAPFIGLTVLLVFAFRQGISGGSKLITLTLGLLGFGVALTESGFLWVPVLINLVLLWSFGSTLFREVSMIEKFARITNPELPAPAVIYCRYVTVVWCAFFIFNGLVSGHLAWKRDLLQWSQYTGGIAYLLMGGLFAIEFCVRIVVKPIFDRIATEETTN